MLFRPINLAIVDDHSLFRRTLKTFLSEHGNINVAIQAADMFELFSKLKISSIDVLLMDIFMPQLNGNEAIKVIRTEYPAIKILVLSMSTDMDLISDLLDAGIHGYISKADEPEDLLQAIQAVSENRIYRNRLFTEALYWNKQNNIKPFGSGSEASLNEREKKILQLIWEEKSNKEIADELFLGVRSVEKIRQDLKEKIGTKSTVGLIKYAINKRIIGVGSRSSDLIR
ncbi:MAG TPA: response regulator transcription factor [Puia sp.]|jgi:DNA-binding NarL/FixJ family response regulator|nr:response regulator transcription factor [Puia sp.]